MEEGEERVTKKSCSNKEVKYTHMQNVAQLNGSLLAATILSDMGFALDLLIFVAFHKKKKINKTFPFLRVPYNENKNILKRKNRKCWLGCPAAF